MPNYYEISPTDDVLTLQQGRGTAGFTVRYVGSRQVEARAKVVALQGAEQSWLQVAEPTTRDLQTNQTQTFKVMVNLPSDAPAGSYGLRLDVMSVDNTDEEYNQGPVVAFEVAAEQVPEAEPEKEDKGFPWWMVIVACVALIAVVVALILVFGSNKKPVAVDDSVGVIKNNKVTINVLANDSDADGEKLIIAGHSKADNGTVTIDASKTKLIYQPRNNFIGGDDFTYTIKDEAGDTAQAEVKVTVRKPRPGPGNITIPDNLNIDPRLIERLRVPLNNQ